MWVGPAFRTSHPTTLARQLAIRGVYCFVVLACADRRVGGYTRTYRRATGPTVTWSSELDKHTGCGPRCTKEALCHSNAACPVCRHGVQVSLVPNADENQVLWVDGTPELSGAQITYREWKRNGSGYVHGGKDVHREPTGRSVRGHPLYVWFYSCVAWR